MKKLAIAAAVVVAVVLMTGLASAKDRWAVIHVTKNFDTSIYPAQCVATVATEIIPTQNAEQVTWLIRNGNAENDDDACPDIDKSMVSLHFDDDVFGTKAMKVLSATQIMHKGKMVWAIQGTVDPAAGRGAHKYRTFYKNMMAGPDPEVEVACGDCGGGEK